MKRFISLFILFIGIISNAYSENKDGSDSSQTTIIDIIGKANDKPTVHRAPLHVYIHAYYDASTNTVEIIYDGETEGEVYLYLNDMFIDYDSNINTTFNLPAASGNYTIEIITDSWTAYGYLKI